MTDGVTRDGSPERRPVVLLGLAVLAVVGLVVAELTRTLADPVQAAPVASFLSAEAVERATAYRAPLRWATLLSVALRVGVGVVAVWWFWRRGRAAAAESRWRRCLSAGAAGAAVWVVSDVVRFPLQAWAWSRSVDVGLSTQTFGPWARDLLVQAVPYWLGVGITIAAAAWLIERAPRAWVPVAGLSGGIVGILMIVVSPLLFEPLLLSFTPLPEGPLREDILVLVEAAGEGEPVRVELLVGDASRRTTASNAYVSGLAGTRRIVLYDTLLADAPDREVLAIVAHELAHDRNRDLERTAVSLLGVSVLLVVALALLLRDRLPDSEGPRRIPPHVGALAAGLTILLLVTFGPVESWASQRSEAAADAGAIVLTGDGEGYAEMMTGLAERNLSDPDPPGWYVRLFHSHPPIGERIARGRAAG